MRGRPGAVPRAVARRLLAAGIAGLGSLALLGIWLAGTAQAAYPGADGLIAFVRGGNIYTIEPTGADLTKLTSNGHASGPRWSPDGEQIAYLDGGNLWIMDADGSHKTQITDAAPGYTDARPSWSPNGRYLAFVKTERSHGYGYLTRYDTVTRRFATFSTPYHSEQPTRRQIRVTALPSAVAWAWALNATGVQFGSFIVFEGAGAQCPSPYKYCLEALGFPAQSDYKNGFPSAEYLHTTPIRLTDPDWFPHNPAFGSSAMTTQEHCLGGHCTPTGLDLTIGAHPILPGAYEGVYSPQGDKIAYVINVGGKPEIYITPNTVGAPVGNGSPLTGGSQPDWQPVLVLAY
jgi:Dipeptidyl peptidase IV (DPP IV) N-terminal region